MAKKSNNGKLTAQNSFEGGLVADLHVMSSPSNTVRHALNMELVTIGEDQYIYQNIRGSKKAVNIGPDYIDNNTKYPYTPLGVKVHNDVAYIMSGAFKPDGTFLAGAIGTFPSPDWDKLNDPDDGESYFEEKYRHLHNFKADGADPDAPYTDPFISPRFKFEKNRFIDMEIQGDFDGSVNILFTDNLNNPGIINSRFKRLENNYIAYLADRANNNDSNTYSNDDWDRVSLVQNANFPVQVNSVIVATGGYLRGGGYRYFFKYATQEGNTTEILYSSPLIPISNGNLGLTKDQISNKKVVFQVEGLNNSYAGIKIFFAHIDGTPEATPDIFEISALYTFNTNTGAVLTITHTGLEDISAVDASEINAPFTPLDTVKSMSIINDRLAVAGITSTLKEEDIEALTEAAKRVTLWERYTIVSNDYSDPKTAIEKVGYWKGEIYEFAIVFMLINKGLSPAFPVTGMDNFSHTQGQPNWEYPDMDTVTFDDSGFSDDANLFNHKGMFRTANQGLIYTPAANGIGKRHVTFIEADTTRLNEDDALDELVSGFFIVRRERVKNVLMQGIMFPTLKIPAKFPTVPSWVDPDQEAMDAATRYLMQHFIAEEPTLMLNSRYDAVLVNKRTDRDFNHDFDEIIGSSCQVDFDTVFVPQTSQLLSVLTYDKAWVVNGNIGQQRSDIKYQKSVTRTGDSTNKMHMTFMSAELDLNFLSIQSFLNGIDPSIEVQTANKYGTVYRSPLMATGFLNYAVPHPIFDFRAEDSYKLYVSEPIGYEGPDPTSDTKWISINSENIKATILESGTTVLSNGAFTAKTDRAVGLYAQSSTAPADDENVGTARFGTPFYVTVDTGNTRTLSHAHWKFGPGDKTVYHTIDYNAVGSSARLVSEAWGRMDRDIGFSPYSLLSQSYSTFLGIEVDVINKDANSVIPVGNDIELPAFYFAPFTSVDTSQLVPPPTSIAKPNDIDGAVTYASSGHLANVFRSKGRWVTDDIRVLYKFDNGEPYSSVTDRAPLGDATALAVPLKIFRGDCFITKISKKVSYKNGVPDSESATAADAGTYGIGLTEYAKHNNDDYEAKDFADINRYDKGRNLFNVGHVVEIASQSNINADIRSIENVSDEETAIYGGPRDFYPNKKEIFEEARPDSSAYNHGYTGDIHVLTYTRIEENAPIYNTSFPNRILLSERNQTQSFFNSFRDLKGFNFRDYGVELGPIVKIIAIKNILLSVHPGGVLAIGVDDKTLLAEGSDVYINTAQALSPTSKTISNVYGSVNPESVIKTDLTIAGVDYNASAVWLFEGNKLSIISEFAVKTILEKFKNGISALNGNPRVYSSFNFVKHILAISYVSEDITTKAQTHIGTVTYNTALQRWSSELSEGTKLSMTMGSRTFTTGFTQEDKNVNTIWEQDALVINDVQIRNNFRGIQYDYEFEFTINMQPSMEKILDNILAITNKVLPSEIVYTTSNDNNDAAVNIWGEDGGEMVVTQKIITRNKSTRRASRLGILEENAYYKNSDLYIAVNKRGSMSRYDKEGKEKKDNKRIRDKHIKVKFVYTGSDKTFLQAIISMLSISYS